MECIFSRDFGVLSMFGKTCIWFLSIQVAQKRKTILDQTSLERQQDMERNRLKLEDLKQSYEKEMLDILNKNKVSIIWKEFFIPISLFLES